MNIILITILLTLLGAGLVILLVWLGLSSWKVMKFKRKADILLNDLNLDNQSSKLSRKINEDVKNLDQALDEYKHEMYNDLSLIRDSIEIGFNELDRVQLNDLWKAINERSEGIAQRFEKLERTIDSRFDKALDKISKLEQTENECTTGECCTTKKHKKNK